MTSEQVDAIGSEYADGETVGWLRVGAAVGVAVGSIVVNGSFVVVAVSSVVEDELMDDVEPDVDEAVVAVVAVVYDVVDKVVPPPHAQHAWAPLIPSVDT